MAQFTVTVPDNVVNEAVEALAAWSNIPVPADTPGKIALAQNFVLLTMKAEVQAYIGRKADTAARNDPNNPAAVWAKS